MSTRPGQFHTKIHETSEGVDQWQCFTYDNLHRLDLGYIHGSAACGAYQAIGPDPFNVDYAYNSIGNITSAAGTGTVSGSYTYSSTKPHAVTQAGTNTYAYDASGNMTTRTTSMGTQTLVYDVLNRLVEINGAGDDMDALYDADGVRVKRSLDGDVVYYLTDSYEIHDPAAGPNSETIHFTLGGVTVGSEIDGTLYVSASDHLGSGSISRDDSGSTDTQRYTPYGAIRGGGGNGLPSDFTFTGQTDDPGTGLIDYNARHYDPQLGRFIMADPVLDGLNRYTYVRNNPVRHTDPTGNCVFGAPCPDVVEDLKEDFSRGVGELNRLCLNTGAGDGCESLAERHPEEAQAVANTAGGTLRIISQGTEEYFIDESKVDWDSPDTLRGEIIGVGLMLPFLRSPGTFASVGLGGGTLDAVGECGLGHGDLTDCALATSAAVVPEAMGAIATLASRTFGDDLALLGFQNNWLREYAKPAGQTVANVWSSVWTTIQDGISQEQNTKKGSPSSSGRPGNVR